MMTPLWLLGLFLALGCTISGKNLISLQTEHGMKLHEVGNLGGISESFEAKAEQKILLSLQSILRNKGECLTDAQEKQVDKSILLIDEILTSTADTLRSAAGLIEDDYTKQSLEKASAIILKMKGDLVDKIKAIAEETCGSCFDITEAVKDAVEVLVNALVDIVPSLKEDRWFDTVVSATNAVISVAEDICRTNGLTSITDLKSMRTFVKQKKNIPDFHDLSQVRSSTYDISGTCLTKEQEDDVEQVVQLAGNVLNTFSEWLRESEDKAQSKQLKQIIDMMADFLADGRDQLEKNGEKTVEQLCEGCAQLTHFADRIVSTVEKVLNTVAPMWKKIPKMKVFVDDIDEILDQVKQVCHYEYNRHGLFKLEFEGCLSSEGVKEAVTLVAELKQLPISISESLFKNAQSESPVNKLRYKEAAEVLEMLSLSLDSSFNGVCISCGSILENVEDVIMRIESVLDNHLPIWRKIPYIRIIDRMVHRWIHRISRFCPNVRFQLRQFTEPYLSQTCLSDSAKLDVKKSVKKVDNAIETVEQAIVLVKDNVPLPETVQGGIHTILVFLEKIKKSFNKEVYWSSEESCNICSAIVDGGESLLSNFEKLLDKEIPNWKDIELIANLDRVLVGGLNFLKEQCGIDTSELGKECLPTAEKEDLDLFIKALDDILTKTGQFVDEVANKVKNDDIKKALEKVKENIDQEKKQLDSNAAAAIENACETCSKSAGLVYQTISKIEDTLDEVLPIWKKVGQLRQLFDQIDELLDDVNKICPFEHTFLQFAELKTFTRFCLSEPDVSKKMYSWIHQASQAFEDFQNEKKSLLRVRSVGFSSNMLVSDEVCFSCVDFVKAAEHVISDIEAFLSNIFPAWQSMPLLPQLDNLVHEILDEASKQCPNYMETLGSTRLVRTSSHSCLTKEENSKLKGLLKYVNQGFAEFSAQLREMENAVPDDQIKKIIAAVENNVNQMKAEVDLQIKNGAEQLCSSCQILNKAIQANVNQIEDWLNSGFPEWKENDLLRMFVEQLRQGEELINDYCPLKEDVDMLPMPLSQHERLFPCEFVPNKGHHGCLTNYQKEKMTNITNQARLGLDIAASVIRLRADFEVNPAKKYTLLEAAKVVKVIGDEVVTNLTKLANEFCGDCGDLADAVMDTFIVLENALFDVEPMWKRTPIYSAVLQLTSDVFEEVKHLCDRSSMSIHKEDCLTPEERENLRYYVEKADGLFNYASDTLETYAQELADGPVKDQILQVAKTIKAIDRDLVQNFTKIANEACGTCLDLVRAMKDLKNSVEAALSDVDPDWREDPKYSAVAVAIDSFIGLMEDICPNAHLPMACDLSTDEIRVIKQLLQLQELGFLLENKIYPEASTIYSYLGASKELRVSVCPNRVTALKLLDFGAGISLSQNSWNSKTVQPRSCEVDERVELLIGGVVAALSEIRETLSATADISLEEKKKSFEIFEAMVHVTLQQVGLANPCAACGEVVATLNDAIQKLREMLLDVAPSLADNMVFNVLNDIVDSMLTTIHDFCPSQDISEIEKSTLQSRLEFEVVEA